jgi:hypothetical protein
MAPLGRSRALALAFAVLLASAGSPAAAAADDADEPDCFDVSSAADYNLDECAFVQRYCSDNVYSRTYYCASDVGKGFFVAACVGWLGLLFVLLGSTVRRSRGGDTVFVFVRVIFQ